MFNLKTRAPGQVEGWTTIEGPVLAGGEIEYESSGSGSADRLWRVVGTSKRHSILQTPGQTLLGGTAARLLWQLDDGRIMLTTASGSFVRAFDLPIQPPVLLAGTTLYELSGRHLQAWDANDGSLQWTHDVPAHAKLQSGDAGVVVYTAGGDVYLDSGTTQGTIHTAGPAVHASLTNAGLFYAFNVHVGGKAQGRVVFVPRSALLH